MKRVDISGIVPGQWAIWWHDASMSTHLHTQTYKTKRAALKAAQLLGISEPIVVLF